MTAKTTTFMNGLTLQEFLPSVARLAQQVRMPVMFLSVETTGITQVTEVGMVECATITVAPSGSVTAHSSPVDPEFAIHWAATKAHGLRSSDLAGAPKFPALYESLSKSFSTCLIVGFNSSGFDVPVVYGNMVRYGLPIMAARHQLDLAEVWVSEMGKKGCMEDLVKHYGIDAGSGKRAVGAVLKIARLLETMLWRHGSDAVCAQLLSSMQSYLTPEMVLAGPGPKAGQEPAPAHKTPASVTGTPVKANLGARGTPVKPNLGAVRQSKAPAPWIDDLKASVEKVIQEHGVVRPVNLPAIAEDMGWTVPKVSIEIGRLLTRGKLRKEPFLIADDQELLALHLPLLVDGKNEIKLKAVREGIKEITGKDVEYIQIRLGLKQLNIWHD